MIEGVKKFQKSPDRQYHFTVLIPSWNNLKFLKLCISSIRKNSSLNLQIIVFINEGNDGTIDWIEKQNDIDYLHATSNLGICYCLNLCRPLVKSDYILYLNDDMYVLPAWDKELFIEIEKINSRLFMLSSTMIEPYVTKNPCVISKNYGTEIENFQEGLLLKEYKNLYVDDWNGSTWPPNIVHVDLWDLVGGMSVEFSPGMYSDPDFSKKIYDAGVRIFKGKGNSLVYHFGSKSTKRVIRNEGRKQFILKWGLTSRTFTQKYLHIGKKYHELTGKPDTTIIDKVINKIKRILNS